MSNSHDFDFHKVPPASPDHTPSTPRPALSLRQRRRSSHRRDASFSISSPGCHSIHLKRTRSFVEETPRDRFITNYCDDIENQVSPRIDSLVLNVKSSSASHTARVAMASGVPYKKRILAPVKRSQTEYNVPSRNAYLHQLNLLCPPFAETNIPSIISDPRQTRQIPGAIRSLDAPGMPDDFYFNLLSWGSKGALAVGLKQAVYVWSEDTNDVKKVSETLDASYTSAVVFAPNGTSLGIGNGHGIVELRDATTGQQVRWMAGHDGQIGCLSFKTDNILTSGCQDGSIWHHDVRVPVHKVMELKGHRRAVCGLTWREDRMFLASGGDDNTVHLWDDRVGDMTEGGKGRPLWTMRKHTAAVKALAWCPWQPSLLATGGGTADASISIWNTTTQTYQNAVQTPAQVTSVIWAPHARELFSTHGRASWTDSHRTNAMMLHSYPSMKVLAEMHQAHFSRILFSALSPAGDTVVTGAGDETLRFWQIWSVPALVDGTGDSGGGIRGRLGSTCSRVVSIR
ncbi:WD40 repeat-like protein [Fistulina hepatica ATCC 64428]|uniref:WD40 repeat-like protein n=1 Tax=Fistulina hepatica ATCC 64428 TaxID=1128425 RepID=A0A0D7A3X0_9AGAR|nr:WD40 repeat-like protein [Fistulina hepatica ATCC 64428]